MKILIFSLCFFAGLFSFSSTTMDRSSVEAVPLAGDANQKIQLALLLDTSNSMDGLIEQAKSRLWNIVNLLTTLKYEGKSPQLEIALYEYGNDGLSAEGNFIRMVTPFTSDLDLISEKLFSLKTNGGSEYCGAVIEKATSDLLWKDGKDKMKLVYIAGNEPFNQGPVHFKEALLKSLKKGIYVNTILCGGQSSVDVETWKEGATAGQGKFFIIDSDKAIQYISTPYDKDINLYNERLNKTYRGYGSMGEAKKMNQMTQDVNAASLGLANMAERAMSKASYAYNNSTWDLVDKYKEDKSVIEKLKKEELPIEYQGLSTTEIKISIDKTIREREDITKSIGELSLKRQAYLESQTSKSGDDLGSAIEVSILELAKKLGYKK